MRLENLIRLIEGRLLTNPAISAISGIAFEPNDVKPGFLYICLDGLQSSLEIAARSGAHALVSDKNIKVTDNEIAWIEVDNLHMALARLARFYIANNNIATYKLNTLEISIAKSIGMPKSFLLIEETLIPLLQSIWEGNLPLAIGGSNTLLIERIAPQAISLPSLKNPPKLLPASTLFHSSFVFEEHFYQHINLPPFWVKAFGRVIKLFSMLGGKFNNFKELSHFVPLFVDKHLCLHPFGATRKALIVESDEQLFKEEVSYMKSTYKMDDIWVCAPKSHPLNVKVDLFYSNEDELLNLNPKLFRYACILGNIGKIEKLLQDQESFKQPSLF